MRVGAVVLAAGQGTRMRSAIPKVLHRVAGRPILGWVLAALAEVELAHLAVVVGPDAAEVRAILPEGAVAAVQRERRGTGDAAQIGLGALDPTCDTVLILCGDTPLVTPRLVAELVDAHRAGGAPGAMVTAALAEPGSYGRVIRRADGLVERIVEARDASAEELAVAEVNAGLYCVDRAALAAALLGVRADNDQGERYLTDAVTALGAPIVAVRSADSDVILGVNTRVDLAACEAVAQDRLRRELMLAGVTMPDPARVRVEASVRVGRDSTLWPGTDLRGATAVGEGCEIGPDAVLVDAAVGDGSRVVSAHIRESRIGAGCEVGPFAYLRPGVELEDGAKVGTYVEVKAARVGRGAKIPHLSYIGDARIGAGTNIGAGNITANYDGFRKHATEIGPGVKTGSDCVFVAPVRIGANAMTGAGSIITHDVPDGALGIARARQSVVEGFTEKAEARARAAAEATNGSEPAAHG